MASNVLARIRQPAVAGSFYPADPSGLAALVDRLLANGSMERPAAAPAVLIVPHAGYLYSGPVAGVGFAQIGDVRQVVLLGCSHHARFDGAVVCGSAQWRTPLGAVRVDEPAVARLLDAPPFRRDDRVHRPEHALEVELPFLQRKLADFTIIPVLLSQPTPTQAQQVSAALARLVAGGALLVVSSDLSHYPSQADAERVDRRTIEAILAGDVAAFQTAIEVQLAAGIPGLHICACAAEAIKVGMAVARLLSLGAARLLKYQNSGSVSSDAARVVGYAAVGFYPQPASAPAQ